ncbi:uncharacterized protein LOC128884096 [Hylaeus volcanicus]|uniref:uncharacterized protein LOC128884096 n=1 Tax=Hylaeus volcanicus TaxID=313075 RepID=UPI0023B796CC|nr:uncharacterized protein LOC128884096 [Hylaeus volcanicus]
MTFNSSTYQILSNNEWSPQDIYCPEAKAANKISFDHTFQNDQVFLEINSEKDALQTDLSMWQYPEDMLTVPHKTIRLGIFVLVSYENLKIISFFTYFYIIVSLVLDGLLILLAALVLCIFWLFCGEVGVKHATSATSLVYCCFHNFCLLGLAIVGILLLTTQSHLLLANDLVLVLLYLVLETTLMIVYSLKSFCIVWGLLRYLCQKFQKKSY